LEISADGSLSDSLRVKALSCISALIRLRSKLPFTQAGLSSENSYEGKGGLMCMAVLAEGCVDHISTKMLSSMLQTVSRSLSDENHVVRCAALFALGQFSEHLHVRLKCQEIEPYLPTLMETILSALNNAKNLKLKVSAVGAIANAAKELLTLSVLAHAVGKEVFSPLAEECVQLGLNLTDAVDDLDLRCCTYSLFSAVCDVSPDCLAPQLTPITSVMLLSLTSTEGVTASEDFSLRSSVHHQTLPLHKLLQVVLPCFLGMVRQDRERQVVMAILESMNAVIKSCQGEALQAPGILAKTSNTIKDVLKKKTEYDAMLQEFSGEGIPEIFYPHQGRAQGGGPVARATAPLPLSAEVPLSPKPPPPYHPSSK
ncbi:hypothetical protein cypCar_00017414, partial [Cyprinus carpio]